MGLNLKWRGDQFNRHLRRATASGLKRAGSFLHSKCREEVSSPNTGTRKRRKRDTAVGPKGSSYTVYGQPSRPGQPPRVRTGTGRSEIVREYNGNDRNPAVRVGVTRKGIYMFYLELGTRRIKARPWLLATLMKFRRRIGELAASGK